MSRTTDALLFAILLVLVHISLILQHENPGSNSELLGFLGLLIGLIAVSGSLLVPLLSTHDQSD